MSNHHASRTRRPAHAPSVTLVMAFLVPVLALIAVRAASIEIPVFTAYSLPNPDGIRISERSGVSRWTDPGQSLHWYGKFTNAGPATARVLVRLPADTESQLRLSLAGRSNVVRVSGRAGDDPVSVDFGAFEIPGPGYHRITLESLNPAGRPAGDIRTLVLDGPAVEGAHFNLEPRRNAASVHLMYPVAPGTNITAFYAEVTAVEDPTTTFYMACGWHRGYFGMQVNSPSERRIIFSVWDSGNEGIDRDKVTAENRVVLMGKGDGVYSGDFGNEGTGGHSHLKYPWKTGEPQRFLVTAQPTQGTFTIFSGYYFHPDSRRWMLISSWKAPHEGGGLRGLHSFSENFWGSSGHLVRKARYGNQWLRRSHGGWEELTVASFSHDPTGKRARLDRYMGVENGQFFLSHGGFLDGFTTYGDRFQRPAIGQPPSDLPPLPNPVP